MGVWTSRSRLPGARTVAALTAVLTWKCNQGKERLLRFQRAGTAVMLWQPGCVSLASSCSLCLQQTIHVLCTFPTKQWRMEPYSDNAGWVSKPPFPRQQIGYGQLCFLSTAAVYQMAWTFGLDSCMCLPFNVEGNGKPGKIVFPAFVQSLSSMKHLQCS